MLTNDTIWKFWYEDDPRKTNYVQLLYIYYILYINIIIPHCTWWGVTSRFYWRFIPYHFTTVLFGGSFGVFNVMHPAAPLGPSRSGRRDRTRRVWARNLKNREATDPLKIETSIVGCWTCWTFFLGDGTSQFWSQLVLLEILGKWNFCQSWSEWSICPVKVWADVNEKFSKRWLCRGERNVVYRLGVLEVG